MRDGILIKGGTIINISKELFLKYLEKPMRWKRNLRGQKKYHMKDNKIVLAIANIQNGFTPNYSVQDYLFTVHWMIKMMLIKDKCLCILCKYEKAWTHQ